MCSIQVKNLIPKPALTPQCIFANVTDIAYSLTSVLRQLVLQKFYPKYNIYSKDNVVHLLKRDSILYSLLINHNFLITFNMSC